MGNTIGTEISPPSLDDMLQKTEPAVEERTTFDCFNSILRVWVFSPHDEDALYVTNEPIPLSSFKGFTDHSCYVVLHLYRNNPVKQNKDAPDAPISKPPTILDIAKSAHENLSPRGQVNCFEGFSATSRTYKSSSRSPESKFDMYIWNGKNASTLIKANSLANVYKLEEALKAGKGMASHREGNLVPLSSVFSCTQHSLYSKDWDVLLRTNHLFSALQKAYPFFGSPVSAIPSSPLLEERMVKSVPRMRRLTKKKRDRLRHREARASVRVDSKRERRSDIPRIEPVAPVSPFPIDKANFRSISLPASKIAQLQGEDFKLDISQVNNVEDPVESKAKKIARLDPVCSKITDNLYLGSDTVARDFDLLKKCGITHVLNCAATICENYFPDRFKYKTLYLYDGSSENISCLFYNVLEFMENAISKDGVIFVHCHQGISRSSAMVILYLMWKEHKPFADVHEFVKSKREICNPNAGFTCQLLLWWSGRTASPKNIRTYLVTQHRKDAPDTPVLRELESPTSVDPRGCYIVCDQQSCLFVWRGADCNSFYRKSANYFVKLLQRFEDVKPNCSFEDQDGESEGLLACFPAIKSVNVDPDLDVHFDLLSLLEKKRKKKRKRRRSLEPA